MDLCDIGLIGLGEMGRNLILNMADHRYSVAGYDLKKKISIGSNMKRCQSCRVCCRQHPETLRSFKEAPCDHHSRSGR